VITQLKQNRLTWILIPSIATAIVLVAGVFSFSYAEEDFSEINESNAQAFIEHIEAKQNELSASWDSYDEAQALYEESNTRLAELTDVIEQSKQKLTETQARVRERAVEMYKGISTYSIMDVFFGSVDFSTFVTQLNMIQHIADRDNALINEAQKAKEEAEALTVEYTQLRESALAEMNRIESLQNQIDAYNEQLHEYYAQLPAEYETENIPEDAYVAEDYGEEPYVGSGIFCHPCPGTYISSDYGYRTFDDSFHKGVDFGASMGTAVYAAESGTVTRAICNDGWNGGAGNNIIIDHGGGLTTWYMHLSSVAVSPGDWVEAGQYIGGVGSTGYSTGPHLHFQVEMYGSAVNPHDYL